MSRLTLWKSKSFTAFRSAREEADTKVVEEGWDNEGGKTVPPKPGATPVVAPIRGRTHKLPEDTVQGRHDRATADLLQSVIMLTASQQLRLERSAESWCMRASLLDRLEKSFEKRRALDRLSDQYEADYVRL